MNVTENIINDLNTAKFILGNTQITLTRELCIRIGQAINSAIELLEEQEVVIRCKDCRYYNSEPDTHGDYCDKIHWSKGPNWFCGDGRRQ